MTSAVVYARQEPRYRLPVEVVRHAALRNPISWNMCRMRRVVAAVLVALAAAPAPAHASRPVACGTKSLFGKKLELRVVGEAIPCSSVRRIVAGRCRETRRWSCFSLRTPDPLLIWFRERERFARRWSTVIEAHRYPCEQANVTAEGWARARASRSRVFPTRMQVYADDIMRCDVLAGQTYAGVVGLLGRPDHEDDYRGRRQLHWEIGPERDSFVQIDSDVLFVEVGRNGGAVTRVEQYQG